jgi:hypothetical protein
MIGRSIVAATDARSWRGWPMTIEGSGAAAMSRLNPTPAHGYDIIGDIHG